MQFRKADREFFTGQLLDWHLHVNDRSFPWKQDKDPYKTWLSEIILQQTRAKQGLPYYLKFIDQYPSVELLAASPDEVVFRLWQGLGYYNRCKNLLATARHIAGELGGKFPTNYEGLLGLKGIGPYTAAAIASFAYDLPHAVVDGNVYRVLARYFGIETATDTGEGRELFRTLAQQLMPADQSAPYNQAIMDLGATVCTPTPCCSDCPLRRRCLAFARGLIGELPVKSKRTAVRKRYFHYLLLIHNEALWIRKRTGKDIWQNLYEPLLVEHDSSLDEQSLRVHEAIPALLEDEVLKYEGMQRQRLTHQLIETRFFSLHAARRIKQLNDQGSWVPFGELKKFPFPRTLVSFLEKKLYF